MMRRNHYVPKYMQKMIEIDEISVDTYICMILFDIDCKIPSEFHILELSEFLFLRHKILIIWYTSK